MDALDAVEVRTPIWPAAGDLPALYPQDAVHLVGIGGAGMSGLARALAARGLVVSGCDREDSPILADLAADGVAAVHVGHDAGHVTPDCRMLIHTPAVKSDHPEVVAARAQGIPVAKRAVLLGALLDEPGHVGVAVAGTHGKTTTTGMVASILVAAGQDPTYFVGGDILDLGTNAHSGAGPHVVIEADEYDRSFLHGHPQVAVITNIELDHPDIYVNLAAVESAFHAFALRVRSGGRLIVGEGSPAAKRLAEALRSAAAIGLTQAQHSGSSAGPDETPRSAAGTADMPAVETFAVEPGPTGKSGHAPDWVARDLMDSPRGHFFDVFHDGDCLGTWQIGLAGSHNVANALGAIAAAEALGVDRQVSRAALASYRGAARRFQLLGEVNGVRIVDDYAHHPTEIAATLAGARRRFPGRRIWAIVQPHTYSRVQALAPEFAASLATADRVLLTPVYAAREAVIEGADARTIARNISGATIVPALFDVVGIVASEARTGDVLIFMGAGDITSASRASLAALRARQVAKLLDRARAAGLAGTVLTGEPLSGHTSLRVGGPAAAMVRVHRSSDLAEWARLAWSLDVPVRVLGRGSNVLAGDEGFDGLVILNRGEGWSVSVSETSESASGEVADRGRVEEDGSEGSDRAEEDRSGPSDRDESMSESVAVVTAEGGVTLAALAQSLARLGWRGLEAGVGIPGSVGAGVVTNAGAHGWAIADSVVSAEVLAADGQVRTWSAAELDFRYRGSALKGDTRRIVLSARLRVARDEPPAILARIGQFTAHRRATQPSTPSVGSMFKNPAGDFAGRLIEAAGLKGFTVGQAQISPLHANFFVNLGGATAHDVRALIDTARREVQRQFGVVLELEIEPFGPDAGQR